MNDVIHQSDCALHNPPASPALPCECQDSVFRKELSALINKYSMENGSNTPDFILAEYMHGALELFDATTAMREKWYGREPKLITDEVPTTAP